MVTCSGLKIPGSNSGAEGHVLCLFGLWRSGRDQLVGQVLELMLLYDSGTSLPRSDLGLPQRVLYTNVEKASGESRSKTIDVSYSSSSSSSSLREDTSREQLS